MDSAPPTPFHQNRQRLIVGTGVFVALLSGIAVAYGNLLVPAGLVGLTLAALIGRWLRGNHIGLLLGLLLIGYVVGNRGFAQLTPAPGLPILPAEAALFWGSIWLVLQGTFSRRQPLFRDAVSVALLVWILLSGMRLVIDLRVHGFYAVRDFALVYYGVFFLIARFAAADPRGRHFIHLGWIVALVALGVILPLYARLEEWFMTALTIRGVPLIAIKNDLAGTFAAAGTAYGLARWWGTRERPIPWALFTLMCLSAAIFLVARAAFVGLVVTAVVFLPGGRGRLASCLAAVMLAGVLIAAVQVGAGERTWTQTRIYDVVEHGRSLLDLDGSDRYVGEESRDTGDNTQFRLVWWRLLVERTWTMFPAFGAGWGADISSEFARDYLGFAGNNDFTARSPHNVILTVFARSGLAGLLPFLTLLGLFAIGARRLSGRARAARSAEPPDAESNEAVKDAALACAAAVIFVSACFGVVLEGPMGAVVAWTLAGAAAGRGVASRSPVESTSHATTLPPWQEPLESANR